MVMGLRSGRPYSNKDIIIAQTKSMSDAPIWNKSCGINIFLNTRIFERVLRIKMKREFRDDSRYEQPVRIDYSPGMLVIVKHDRWNSKQLARKYLRTRPVRD